MAKKKSEDQELNEMIAKEQHPEHTKPQAEPKGPRKRPELAHPDHAKPQKQSKAKEAIRPKPVHPSHTKPQQ